MRKLIYILLFFTCFSNAQSLPILEQLRQAQIPTGGGSPTDTSSQISSSFGDIENSGGSLNSTSTSLEIPLTVGNVAQTVGLHFTGLSIPQGATINSAYIEFVATATRTGYTINTLVQAEDVDNAAIYTSSGTDLPSRVLTTETATWSISSVIAETTYQTQDISNVIQEVVNRAGFTTASNINLILNDIDAVRPGRYYSYDNTPSKAAKLYINYTP